MSAKYQIRSTMLGIYAKLIDQLAYYSIGFVYYLQYYVSEQVKSIKMIVIQDYDKFSTIMSNASSIHWAHFEP